MSSLPKLGPWMRGESKNVTCQIRILGSPYYTMRFPYFALAFYPSPNKTQMERK